MEQPQWFYSSLAQVTAALVGFIGGFLLLRLLEVMREWKTLLDRLQDRQSKWSRAERLEWHYDQTHESKLGPYQGEKLRLNNDTSDSWSALYDTLQERSAAKMPVELLASLGAVTTIALVFGLGPLLALDHPSFSERMAWTGGLATGLSLVAVLLANAVRSRHKQLHSFKIYPHTQGHLDEYEAWIEGMVEQERWEKAQREKAPTEPAESE